MYKAMMNFFIVAVMLNYGFVAARSPRKTPQELERLDAAIANSMKKLKSPQAMCQKLQHLSGSSSEKTLISRGEDWLLGKSEADFPNYPDKKYEEAGDEVIENTLKAIKSWQKLFNLGMEDKEAMMQKVYDNFVTKQNVTAAKRIAGEYNIASTRRYLKFGTKLAKRVNPLLMKTCNKLQHDHKLRHILDQFSQLMKDKQLDEKFFTDCHNDEPMVRAYRGMFKAGISLDFAVDKIDSLIKDTTNAMLRDFVYLDQDKKDHEGALQRAGESAISWFRQQQKIGALVEQDMKQAEEYKKKAKISYQM